MQPSAKGFEAGTPSCSKKLAKAGFLSLPGLLLAQIFEELDTEDRKSLCCTARDFRECEGQSS
jgi:hypothetical protein